MLAKLSEKWQRIEYNLHYILAPLISFDVILTLTYFEFESNPLVIYLGMTWFAFVNIFGLILLMGIWEYFKLWEIKGTRLLMILLIIWHIFAVITNIFTIIIVS